MNPPQVIWHQGRPTVPEGLGAGQKTEGTENLPIGEFRGQDRHRRRGAGQDQDSLGGPVEPREGIQVSLRGTARHNQEF